MKIIETTPDTVVVQIKGVDDPVTYERQGDWGAIDLENLRHGCLRCEHTRVHGWIGLPGADTGLLAHCGGPNGCHRDWPSRSEQCHCTADGCHEHFKSERAFDEHQERGRCSDPATLKRGDGHPVLVEKPTPFGSIWTRWDPREPPSAAAGSRRTGPDGGPDGGDGGAAALPVPEAEAGSDGEELEAA